MVRLQDIIWEAKRLQLLGFRLALDDTGAGNAGLEMLSQLQVDFVKVDRAVVANALSDKTAHAILTGIQTIAREANVYVTAEGIENLEMLGLVGRVGIQGAQGNLLERPSETIPGTAPWRGSLCRRFNGRFLRFRRHSSPPVRWGLLRAFRAVALGSHPEVAYKYRFFGKER